MRIKLDRVETFERPVRLRLPFRYGIMVLTEAPQAFLRARISDEAGRTGQGIAAEVLAPKWFDKNPELSNEDNFEQLRAAIRIAANLYLASSRFQSPFELSLNGYRSIQQEGGKSGLNPLVAGFGPALLDRAVLDAVCRLEGVSFWESVRYNLPGLNPHPEAPDLQGHDWHQYLRKLRPLKRVQARHTVGLADPITSLDQAPGDRIDDGLPETLEEAIQEYGHRFFKVKVSGGLESNMLRMEAIAGVLDRLEHYHVTLDANEQFETREQLRDFTGRLATRKSLRRFWNSILFIEQPLDRRIALDCDLQDACPGRPVIVDESDGTLDSFLRARQLGYRGITSKTCKGFYKSILNRARCSLWNRQSAPGQFFMSGEDLTTQAGVAVQQDLALAALLGLHHIERNGHHYVKGFSGVSAAEQTHFLEEHPDLYRRVGSTVCLKIREGGLDLGSLGGPGFGTRVLPDFDLMEPGMAMERG